MVLGQLIVMAMLALPATPVVGEVTMAAGPAQIQRDGRMLRAVVRSGVEPGDRLETGTVYMNRCDYLDPALAWVGVKDSGRGATLSRVGYEMLTRPKSFHLRKI